jgi:hypothetical protein
MPLEKPAFCRPSVRAAQPLRVALFYSSPRMRGIALESCLATVRTLSERTKIEILSLPLDALGDFEQRARVFDEPPPDLLVLAAHSGAEAPEAFPACLAEWIDQQHTAIVGVYGADATAPLLARAFHQAFAKLAEQMSCAYFSRTVFLGVSASTVRVDPVQDSILNE